MHNLVLTSHNNNLAFVISRLTALRGLVLTLLFSFIAYLELNHLNPPTEAWLILAAYLPLILMGIFHIKRGLQTNAFAAHLMIEIQIITIFLYFTGGASNPFISYLLVLIVIAAYNLNRLWVWAIATACIVDYTLLTQFFQPLSFSSIASVSGHEQHMSMHNPLQGALVSWHLAGMWLTFVVSAIALSLFIPSLMEATILKRQELAELREKQLKNEQLIGIATLAAGTAHEMGTPLMTMEMLLSDCLEHNIALSPSDSELLHQQVMICRQALQRLALAGRNIHNQNEFIDAEQWLTHLLHRWRLSQPNALWKNQGIEQAASIQKSPLLDQAMLNLLDNAAQAGQDTIELSTRVVNHQWLCTIHQPDQCASKQLQQHRLFASEKENGIGLGLYLSNASIEQFNGQVHLSANKDGSTTCIISLPCKDEH